MVNITPFEPEWEGFPTISIANTTRVPVKVYANEGLCQVLFFQSDEPCEVSYADRNGKYQAQTKIYLLRDGALTQLTKDHSYVQEQVDAGLLTPEQARYHPYSNVITRCVGAGEEVEADTFAGEFRSGDVFLVCSDGLTGMVDDRRLQQLLLSRASAGRIVDALIAEANYRGGLDNVTAVVVQILSADTGDDEKTEEAPALSEGDTPTSSPATNAA
jgi:hypothetical protein